MEYVLIVSMAGFFIHGIYMIREDRAQQKARADHAYSQRVASVKRW